jgi:hypothetical protein
VPGATPHPNPTPRTPVSTSTTNRFSVGPKGYTEPDIAWGSSAQSGIYKITATCSSAGGDVTSPAIAVTWT